MVQKLSLTEIPSSLYQLCLSNKLSGAIGVPQRTVIGELILSIYVNDLRQIAQPSAKWAPNFSVLNDSARAMERIHSDLLWIRIWRFDNCFMINPHKTNLIAYGIQKNVLEIT